MHESITIIFPPPTCIAHTIAILLHDLRNIRPPTRPDPLLYATHHTILVIAISCKGETLRRLVLTRYIFTARLLCTNQSSLYPPPPTFGMPYTIHHWQWQYHGWRCVACLRARFARTLPPRWGGLVTCRVCVIRRCNFN